MIKRLFSGAVLAFGMVALIEGCASAPKPQAASPTRSVGDVAVLYVPPPGAARADAVPAPVEMNSMAGGAIANDAIWQRNIASHSHLIAHRSNLAATINDEKSAVRLTKWYGSQGSPSDALAWLQQHVRVAPVPGTALIELSIDGEIDRDESAIIVNDVASHYLEGDRRREMDKLVEQIDLYSNLKSRYDAQARSIRNENSNLAAALQLDGMGRPGFVGQKEQELQLLTVERLKAMGEATAAENAFKQATSDAMKGRTPGLVEAQINQDWEIMNLRHQVDLLMAQGGPNAAAQVEKTQSQLSERSDVKRKGMTEAYLANLEGQWQVKNANVETMSKQIEQLKNDLAELGARVSQYLARREEETAFRDMSRRYADQLDRLNAARAQWEPGQIVFAARAGEGLRASKMIGP